MSAGMRAVLVIPRTDVGKDPALKGAIDQILHGGGQLVAVVAPEDHMKALQMVLDDQADVVVVTNPEHFPLVQFAAYMTAPAPRSAKRTQRVMRPGALAEGPRPVAADHPWRKTFSEQRRLEEAERHQAPETGAPVRTGRVARSTTPAERNGGVRTRRSQTLRRAG